MMVFAEYQKRILDAYQEGEAAGGLHAYIARPSPAKLRELCESVYSDRYSKKDEQTIRTFFGKSDDKGSYLKAIEGFDIDRFKPLINLLKDPAIKTDEKNVELLAWLIDFKPRPFNLAKEHFRKLEEEEVLAGQPGQNEKAPQKGQLGQPQVEPQPPQVIPGRPGTKRKAWALGLAITVILLVFGGIIYRRPGNMAYKTPILTGTEACMFWAGDHYQQVSCGTKLGDTLVLALDSEKVSHFKKITNWDTVTEKSIGRVWYIKINKNLELYTCQGPYPMDQKLRLRPLSEHMYRTYIHPNQ
ncbi:MAG: hypothetical protein JST68_17370 [Bacteroidetes bacterium]|nr:hypothetical protein [Bacteroidota bacterium]